MYIIYIYIYIYVACRLQNLVFYTCGEAESAQQAADRVREPL